MKLTQQAINAIRESKECRAELLYQMEISSGSLYNWLSANDENGKLTTALALKIIAENTGLKQNQLLTKN